jgi:hypothetical protein
MVRASSDIGRAVFMDNKWLEPELVPLRESGWRISATATFSGNRRLLFTMISMSSLSKFGTTAI